ncbi:MAG: AarF/UbiB family protein [Tepidiformaceae bacterium]
MDLPGHHIKRRLQIGKLLLKYGRADLVQVLDLDEAALRGDEDVAAELKADPEQFARDLEEMGPTFIKVGQLLSTRPDLLAQPYLDALSRLQDSVDPFSFADVERIVEEDLSVRISKAFASFESTPLGAASLAQVHRAELRDGRNVVVKVQRPEIREQVIEDLTILEGMVGLVSAHSDVGRRFAVDAMFGEFRRAMVRELDFRREAKNLETIARHLEDYPLLLVPKPINDFSSSRVLTMEHIEGKNVSSLTPLARLELDGEALAESLVKGYLELILIHGVFSADPHPGNLLVTPAGELGLIDMGMVAYLRPQTQDFALRLLVAASEGDSDEVANVIVAMSEQLEDFDELALKRAVADLILPNREASMADLNLGRVVMEMVRIAARCGVRPSPDLTMLGKTLLNLDETTRLLAPDMQPNAIIEEHAASLMQRHLLRSISPGNLFNTALELNEFVQRLPGRMNTIMERITTNQIEVKVHAFDEERLMSNLQKIANRITLGLVVAALIVGAALLTRVPTSFEILGYPALAIILFLGAAAVGFALVVNILLTDRRGAAKR